MKDKFNSLEILITHLKGNSNVIAVIEYGFRSYTDMDLGGDYDFFIITTDKIKTEIDGLHFHVGFIPVDCNIRTLSELQKEKPVSLFDYSLFTGRIIFDKSGTIPSVLKHAELKWPPISNPFNYGEIQWERFTQQHVIDKFEHRLFDNELFSQMHLNMNINWLFDNYVRIKYKQYSEPKNVLHIMKKEHPETYNLFQEYHSTLDLKKKLEITKSLTKLILEPIGGPWKKGEVIFQPKNWEKELMIIEKEYLIKQVF